MTLGKLGSLTSYKRVRLSSPFSFHKRATSGEHLGRGMEHYSRFCEKVFNRSYNRDRYEKQNCRKRFVGEQNDIPYTTKEVAKQDEDSIGE